MSGFLSRKEFTKERIQSFGTLVREARSARAYPDQSGFFVRTAGITKSGIVWKGGNKEYGHTDAFIHGETAVVSALKDLTDDPIDAIAWYQRRGSESARRREALWQLQRYFTKVLFT